MAAVEFQRMRIPKLLKIEIPTSSDARGSFNKTYVSEDFAQAGLATSFAEEYYTASEPGVCRGMHFQLPPMDLDKIVFCVSGSVFDVVVDLRRGSPTYLQAETFTLFERGPGLHIPSGCAHGFATTNDRACLSYKTTAPYSAEHDAGILWSSVPVEWPVTEPIVSSRDSCFASLSEFDSPFVFSGGAAQ